MNTAQKLLGIIVLGLFISTVFLSIGASSKGAEVLSLEKEIKQLEEENAKLTGQLITETSLTDLSLEKETLGLVTPEQVVYLTGTEVAQVR